MTAVQLTDRQDYCFTCSQGKKLLSVSVWDVRTGITLRVYSCDTGSSQGAGQGVRVGGAAALCLLGGTHLLLAAKTIPFIYVWDLRKEQVLLKIACAGIVRALCCSPDGVYCAGGIAEKIYIWHVCTGDLLAVLCQHFQPVTAVQFTDDGVHVVSGAEDGRVIVWKLVSAVSQAQASVFNGDSSSNALALASSSSLTRHVWADHTLPITDLHCSKGGLHSRIFTTSLDQTCKVYELMSGHLLCSILFDFALTCVAVDLAEQWLFVGGSTGKICRVNLYTKPLGPELGEDEMREHYTGHGKAISGLAIASWDNVLVSTSLLETEAKVWDIASNQALREIKMKGPISKMCLSGGLFQSLSRQHSTSSMPNLAAPVVKVFKKQIKIRSDEERSSQPAISFPIRLRGIDPVSDYVVTQERLCHCVPMLYFPMCFTGWYSNLPQLSDLSCLSELQSMYCPAELSMPNSSEKDFTLQSVRQELAELKEVHKKLYTFCMDKLIA